MKSEYKKRWLEALRSGIYPQTRGALCRQTPVETETDGSIPIGNCCLGVLCDVLKDDVGGHWEPLVNGHCSFESAGGENHMNHSIVLPDFVSREVRLKSSPEIYPPDTHPIWKDKRVPPALRNHTWRKGISLAFLNDRGFTFAEIADLIEEFIPAE